MKFNEKLRQLRKQKGLTQEQLAQRLYVSRTAVSKWESGRGWPTIDSLKDISIFFGISIDSLLSAENMLDAAQQEHRKKILQLQGRVFGILDLCCGSLFALPLFGQNTGGVIRSVSLLQLDSVSAFLKHSCIFTVALLCVWGVAQLVLQKTDTAKMPAGNISFVLNAAATLLFIAGKQPYPAALLFVFLLTKICFAVKK